jgi:hypothetical protein
MTQTLYVHMNKKKRCYGILIMMAALVQFLRNNISHPKDNSLYLLAQCSIFCVSSPHQEFQFLLVSS